MTIHRSLEEIDEEQWNSLVPEDSPVLLHQFLAAFEHAGCVAQNTGWEPYHLTLRNKDRLLAASPCYLKHHSYGEFIFDWAWAKAYEQAGLAYYPKLLLAIPFTPITGKRLLIHPSADQQTTAEALISSILELATITSSSSVHCLFTTSEDNQLLQGSGFLPRSDNQFHWHNQKYGDFDEFLTALSSRKRKNIQRERGRIRSDGITFRWLRGEEATTHDWSLLYNCYRGTVAEHSSIPYLNHDFFQLIAKTMTQQVRLLVATRHGCDIASAFFLAGNQTLFGRYWGSLEHVANLHFEACYYQPIEYCISNGIQNFEAGAQGEHKLTRGLTPTRVLSAHWLRHPDFFDAIQRYTQVEREYLEHYQAVLRAHSPYRERRKIPPS